MFIKDGQLLNKMSILSTSELQNFTGAAIELFDQASSFHSLTIFKEPVKTIANINNNEYNGYGYQASPDNYSFTQNSGTYNVVVVSVKNSFDNVNFDPIPIEILKGQKLIKVKNDCKEFIENGKNVLFLLDGLTYNNISNPMPRCYGGLTYNYYSLERTT